MDKMCSGNKNLENDIRPRQMRQITEMAIRTGLILSQDLVVQRNMVGLCGGIFTLQITDMADSHGIKITDNRNYYKWLEVTR